MTCKDCEAEVRMCETRSGRRIMMNVEHSPTGKYVIIGDTARLATAVDDRLLRPRFVCHWDVCPARSPK